MNQQPFQKSRLLLPITLGLCLGVGVCATAWALHRGVHGWLDRQARGRTLVSEDGALNIIAQASSKGHTRADKGAAVARIKQRGCPFPRSPHSLWVLDDQGKTLVLCGGKDTIAPSKDPDAIITGADPRGMLNKAQAADLLARIRREGFGRLPPIHARELEAENSSPHLLSGRQFEPWRWIVGTTLNIERIRGRGQQYQRWALMAGSGGGIMALLCLLGLALLARRRP